MPEVSQHLSAIGLDVRVTPDSIEALGFIRDAKPALVFIDVDEPRYGGVRVAELAVSLHSSVMIVLTAGNAAAVARAYGARAMAAVVVVEKSISPSQVQRFVEAALGGGCMRPLLQRTEPTGRRNDDRSNARSDNE